MISDKNPKILLIADRVAYTLKAVEDLGIDLDFSYFKTNILEKVLRRFCYLSNVFSFDIWFAFKNRDVEQYDTIILFECRYPAKVIEYIRRKNSSCRIIYWLWNTILEQSHEKLYSQYKETCALLNLRNSPIYKFEIWSFDKIDCHKYNLNYNNQFSYKININNIESYFDFAFCGQDKGRLELLKEMANVFNELRLSWNFMVLPDKNKKYFKESYCYFMRKSISYEEVIGFENHGRCIIDIVQKNQGGITWRPLEALYYKKKLVTNFKNIVQYDFYNNNNIFIWGKDDIFLLPEFLQKPYCDTPSSIINKYLAHGWLENFNIKM